MKRAHRIADLTNIIRNSLSYRKVQQPDRVTLRYRYRFDKYTELNMNS